MLNILLVAFLAMVVLMNVGFEGEVGATLDILWHLVTGFVRFLDGNMRKVSSDSGTWGPGLAAFLIAAFVGHRILRSWSGKRQLPWSMRSTACVALLLPVLFFVSFLVPGALLQLRELGKVAWFEHQRRDRLAAEMKILSLQSAIRFWERQHDSEKLPPSLAALVESKVMNEAGLHPPKTNDAMADPPLYLGAGLTRNADPSLPLLISSSYQEQGIRYRAVLTLAGSLLTITDDELNEWIDRTMAARDGVKP